ncbi:alpha-mannosidase [Musicola paradisiaca]|uniref:Glycosyl hydrolase 38 domain protein n=1 Tax=Musicola paradisiaca (strain Ech703) TaxID=579405 RepID=C6CA33_MUSP7|nr:alpha-mannosidase [Musicola paradisiaca]ACS84508.1 glycosyl hydrolase 38 domain protein [Musicola paradisiaca Ech703]
MFFTEEKLSQRLDEVAQYRWREAIEVELADICFDREGENGTPPPPDAADWQPCQRGFQWREKDIYVWLRLRIALPAHWATEIIAARFDFSLGVQRRDFEALLYLNGEPWQGLDQNHVETVIPSALAGQTIECCCRVWSGILEGKVRKHFQAFHVGNGFERVSIAVRDEAATNLFYTTEAILQSLAVLPENDPHRVLLLAAADRAYNLIDWREPGSAECYHSLAQAAASLEREYPRSGGVQPVTVHCVGHTHIDVAFLWQLKHTREKCARSFSTVLRLMERYPEYVFFQSQPQLYDYLKQDYPAIYRQIKQRIAEGRWEVDGAMWVEADCNLPSGESFVRQILLGTRFMQQEFGVTPRCLWLPDVFGYSWALPQILRKSGIRYFMTTKISWNEFNQMPHDTFTWRGIDGSEVLAHFITTPEEGHPRYTYNGMVNAMSVQGLWDNYKDKPLNQELMLAYGYGDGGGGPTEEMLELLRRFEKVPALPNIRHGRVDDYFTRLEQRLADSDAWQHVWDGELYFESHRGTYTSQAQVKKANRRGELTYRRLEWLHAQAAVSHADWPAYPQVTLNAGWQILLRNQFHDIIPGSSIAEVYRDAADEYRQAEQLADEMLAQCQPRLLSARADAVSVLNSAAWPRSDLAFIAGDGAGGWMQADGQPLASQAVAGGWLVALREIPALSGVALYRRAEQEAGDLPFSVGERQVETPFYQISWNEHGQLTRIFDRQHQRDVLADCGNVLTVYEDKPLKYDAWDIEIFYIQKQRPVTELLSATVREQGELCCSIEFVWRYHHSRIVQQMRLYRDSRRIDFHTQVDWQDYNQLLKVGFPVAVRATEATYDIQFGNVKRPTTWNTSWDYARFESVAHQWADLSEYGYGVSLLNDCKYGHAIRDNLMQLTLIKSAVSPDAHADRGQHEFTYSLLPHAGDWREAGTAQQAFFLNEPLLPLPGEWLPEAPLVAFDHPYIQLDALKKAEDGNWLVVRLHEFAGGRQNVVLRCARPVRWWAESDLLENLSAKQMDAGQTLELHFAPYEIKTLVLCLAD